MTKAECKRSSPKSVTWRLSSSKAPPVFAQADCRNLLRMRAKFTHDLVSRLVRDGVILADPEKQHAAIVEALKARGRVSHNGADGRLVCTERPEPEQ